jgi:hypothetical protein
VGPANTTFCHFFTDRSAFYMEKRLEVDGNLERSGWLASDRQGYWFGTNGDGALRGDSPTFYFRDRNNNKTAAFHLNGDEFYILRHGSQETNGWDSGPNGRHPMIMNIMSGDVTFSGNVTAFSDARLKSDIHNLTGSSSLLSRQVPRSYIMDGVRQFGLVAQEVQEVIPFLVSKAGEYLTVNYTKLITPLIAGWQDHEKELQQVSNKLRELEDKYSELERRLLALESK